MDIAKVLSELRAELANLDAAIASLERIENKPRGPGRPPGSRSSSTLLKAAAAARRKEEETAGPRKKSGSG